jgi:hypothetical protein
LNDLHMTIALPTLAIAFAAFCVWLAVRIVNRRERWAKWLAAGLMLVVMYPLSSGPSRWVLVKAGDPRWLTTPYIAVYSPLYTALARGPKPLFDAAVKYRFWWSNLALGLDPDSPSPTRLKQFGRS